MKEDLGAYLNSDLRPLASRSSTGCRSFSVEGTLALYLEDPESMAQEILHQSWSNHHIPRRFVRDNAVLPVEQIVLSY
jgi:hypothetical protein